MISHPSENSRCAGLAAVAIVLAVLAGCAAPIAPQKAADPSPQERARQTAAAELNQGIDLYNRGEYQAAIKQLSGAGAIWSGDKDLQLEALKYTAFSYCVTSRPVPCRQEFEKALKLDPRFDLSQGEKGHPLWGPVFDRLKKNK